ncbi:MAG TPA: FHA domain-containing protein [Steroidobacteraceae bacterium]|nr:FHA domain-containing protein [Steroidobacteraceae bacterium]
MSSSSLTSPPVTAEADLDSTAELPVLDPPSAAAEPEAHTSTDTWAALPQLRPEGEPQLQAALERLSGELRVAQQLINTKGDRIRELEQEREEARAALAAAEERAVSARAAAERQQAALAEQAQQLAQLTQARLASEQHAAALAAELSHVRAGGQSTSEQLAALRGAAEQRAAQLDAELKRLQLAATRHSAEFAELTQERTQGAQRIRELEVELTGARGEAAAAGVRATQLEQQLREAERATAARQAAQQAEEARRGVRERARAAHLGGIMHDLHAERSRAAACLESLQTLSVRRSLLEEQVTELHDEAQARGRDLARIAQELVMSEQRVRDQDSELKQRAGQVAQLERRLASSTRELEEREAQLQTAQRDSRTLADSVQRLQAQLEASGERVRALSVVAEQHNFTETQRKGELSRLLNERVQLTSELESAQAQHAALATRCTEQEQALARERARTGELEGLLAAEKRRGEELDGELTALRREMDAWTDTLQSVHRERGSYQASLSALEERIHEAERRSAEARAELTEAQAEARGHAARVRELESDLTAAEDTVHRLESAARKSGARVEELEKAQQHWRNTFEEARQNLADIPALPRGGARGPEPAESGVALPDGAVRLLICSVDGREVVHVLGRKTSVGRTPDNDLQIDAKFISRHHAVILAGPAQTIIEDLNSTNGVQVNGRRITRQALVDGDVVAIGRQQYRFAVRRSEKR